MEANGHFDAEAFEARQEQRFTDIQGTMRDGFRAVVEELKLSRSEGHIPVSVMQKILESLQHIIVPIVKCLCAVVGLLLAWVTGIKYLAPLFGVVP